MDGVKIISQTQSLTIVSLGVLIFLSIIFGIILSLIYYKLGKRKKSFKPIMDLFPPIIIWFAGFFIGVSSFENVIPFDYTINMKSLL